MASNLCFSFRGLYQKLFRGSGVVVDDLNLQFRMQQLGLLLLIVPCIVWEGPSLLEHVYQVSIRVGLWQGDGHMLVRYGTLATVNGLAFTSYK
jgi:hypothetical protein